ncbi:unnamed protein product [Vicia faba]|uniref:Neuroguidin n=1 Tax=Vicia faba TaxID=3906 RepID=A0AAV1AJF1_VICFA|nr:unnamed protein product [Vicia faba]
MENPENHLNNDDITEKEASQLAALLKEMKEGLDNVNRKIQTLTAKVKAQSSTADGFSYLEAKNLLLLNYCQSLVYYLLRKAKGYSIEEHPVVRSIVEIRLFLEKIRPIDKKQQYQIQKVIKASESATSNANEKVPAASDKSKDVSKYRPIPGNLISKIEPTAQDDDGDDVYRPPRIAPTSMDMDKSSKQERNAIRRDREILKQAKQSDFIRTMVNDMEGRPEEIRDFMGTSREVDKYVSKADERSRQEEELFTRVPMTKQERKKEKHMKKATNGIQGLTESLFDEIKGLPFEDDTGEQTMGFKMGSRRNGKHGKLKKRKACLFDFDPFKLLHENINNNTLFKH